MSVPEEISSSESAREPEAGSSAGMPVATLVIGSGFGGAATAARLAQAGIPVVLLERGRRFEANDFPALPVESALLPDARRWNWKGSQGLFEILDLEEVVSIQAAGYGGGSLVYANVHMRPASSTFAEGWPSVYRDPETLAPFFDLAAYTLDVAPITSHADLMKRLVKADQMERVATALGRGSGDGFFHPALAVSHTTGPNRQGRLQNKCTGCGKCCTGCPEKAKNTLDYNYLAIAETHGARVFTQCEVRQIIQAGDHLWEIACIDHLGARNMSFWARDVFLCAGVANTTRLLKTARFESQEARETQDVVGLGYFPGADALGMVFDTVHPQFSSFGPTITSAVTGSDGKDGHPFFMIQDGGIAPELSRLVGVGRAPLWVGRNRLTRSSPTAAAGPSPLEKPLPPAVAEDLFRTPSPLDEVLDAIKNGDFRRVASDDLRRQARSFRAEAQDPLLMSAVVGRTIDLIIERSMATHWWTSWIDRKSFLYRFVKTFERFVIRFAYGAVRGIADDAFTALLTQGGLGRHEVARQVLGYARQGEDNRAVLLAMGKDLTSGVLHYDQEAQRLIADLDLYHAAPLYSDQELLMSDLARGWGGELRTNPAWAFLGKPVTVHNQGGCAMSDEPDGVTTPDGEVRHAPGLHVADASLFPRSVGVNPSATILALAERNVLTFIRRKLGNPQWPEASDDPRALAYKAERAQARIWVAEQRRRQVAFEAPEVPFRSAKAVPLGIRFDEHMEGYIANTAHQPATPEDFRALETKGRPAQVIRFDLRVGTAHLAQFLEDLEHRLDVSGSLSILLPGTGSVMDYQVQGSLLLFVERQKPYGIDTDDSRRRNIQTRLGGSYRTIKRSQADRRRQMIYRLAFRDRAGRPWRVEGTKLIHDDPGFDAWRDTSHLFVTIRGPATDQPDDLGPPDHLRAAGVAHVDLDGFLHHQLPSLTAIGCDDDPTRALWAKVRFATFFFGELQRIYSPHLKMLLETFFKLNPSNVGRAS